MPEDGSPVPMSTTTATYYEAETAASTAAEDEERAKAEQAKAEQTKAEQAKAERTNWTILIAETIHRHWQRPIRAPKDFRAIVHVEVLPTGQLASAKIKKSSGNAAVDRSVFDAVAKSTPLPPPPDPAAYDRDLDITFVPPH
jgi:colicin import membrane protein